MSIFIKKQRGNLEEQGFKKTSANRFAELVEKKKQQAAGWLNKKTVGYSPAHKKIGLFVFCIFFGGLSIYLLASSISGHSINTRFLNITHLRSGVHDPDYSVIYDSIYQKAKRIERWMDSLRSHDTVRLKAILLAEPFLMERLDAMKNLYDPQNK